MQTAKHMKKEDTKTTTDVEIAEVPKTSNIPWKKILISMGVLVLALIAYGCWQLGSVGYLAYAMSQVAEEDSARISYQLSNETNKFVTEVKYHKNTEELQQVLINYESSAVPSYKIGASLLGNNDEGFAHLSINPTEIVEGALGSIPPFILQTKTYEMVRPFILGEGWLHTMWPKDGGEKEAESSDEDKSRELASDPALTKVGVKLMLSGVVNSSNPFATLNGEKHTRIAVGIRKNVLLGALDDLKDTEVDIKLSQLNALIKVIESSNAWKKDLLIFWVDQEHRLVKVEILLPNVSGEVIAKGVEESMKDTNQTKEYATEISEQIKALWKNDDVKELVELGAITLDQFGEVAKVEKPTEIIELDAIIEKGAQEILPIFSAIISGQVPTTPTSTPTTSKQTTTKPKGPCFQYTINGGPYSGTKCYTQDDSARLDSLISQYNALITEANALSEPANAACSGDDQNACYNAAMAFNNVNAKASAIEKQIASIVRRGW
jgi:hypothetical protein